MSQKQNPTESTGQRLKKFLKICSVSRNGQKPVPKLIRKKISKSYKIEAFKCSFNCEECKKGFPLKRDLRVHILTHESNRSSVTCHSCGKSFIRIADLEKHVLIHESKLFCGDNSRQKRKADLNSHSTVKGIRRGEVYLYECETCSKSFTRYENLRKHAMKHVRSIMSEFFGRGK